MSHEQDLANDPRDVNEFTRLLAEHERGVLLFILSLIPNWGDAEEILQETNIKLWLEFGKFQPGSNFGKWARTIARYQTLAFAKREQRERLRMSTQDMDSMAADVAVTLDQEKTRPALLTKCVEELSPFGRELVRLYYAVGEKIEVIANELNCTPGAAYKSLQRTRIELRQCVDRKLREAEKT
jgi:RNA polymerase sigma-70 factor, ECF subfamily